VDEEIAELITFMNRCDIQTLLSCRLDRAAWDLAQKVTHGNLGRIEAFAAAQAIVLVVRTLQALAAEATAPAPPWL
jgi:hypothetical protein